MNNFTGFCCVGLSMVPLLVCGDDFVVSSAAVTAVRSVDEGFKTFVQAPLSAPTTQSIEPGASFSVAVFQLYTNEDKVNTEEPAGGDTTKYPITATVTFGAPINQTLTFQGSTWGEEDLSGVPANLVPILSKPNPNQFEALQLLQWGLANPEEAKKAGGRGLFEWNGSQTVDLGAGKSVEVKLENGVYNEGLQFGAAGAGFGTGPGNAGTVMVTVTLMQETTETGLPIVSKVLLVGDEVAITYPTRLGFSYHVEQSFDTKSWTRVENSDQFGTGGDIEYSVPKPANQRALFVRVVCAVTPMMGG